MCHSVVGMAHVHLHIEVAYLMGNPGALCDQSSASVIGTNTPAPALPRLGRGIPMSAYIQRKGGRCVDQKLKTRLHVLFTYLMQSKLFIYIIQYLTAVRMSGALWAQMVSSMTSLNGTHHDMSHVVSGVSTIAITSGAICVFWYIASVATWTLPVAAATGQLQKRKFHQPKHKIQKFEWDLLLPAIPTHSQSLSAFQCYVATIWKAFDIFGIMHNAIASVVMFLEEMLSCNGTQKSGATVLLLPCVIDPKSRMAWTQKAETGQLFQHANTKHKKGFEQTV